MKLWGLKYLVVEHREGDKLLDFVVLSSFFELALPGTQQSTNASSWIGHLFLIGVPSRAALIASLSAIEGEKDGGKKSGEKEEAKYAHLPCSRTMIVDVLTAAS